MNPNESAAFLRSDEDDPDYLRDKPMGRCPWDGWRLDEALGETVCMRPNCPYSYEESELDNRARYQEERMAEALVNERVNRELRGAEQ